MRSKAKLNKKCKFHLKEVFKKIMAGFYDPPSLESMASGSARFFSLTKPLAGILLEFSPLAGEI